MLRDLLLQFRDHSISLERLTLGYRLGYNKMFSYRRETALQGALVLAKSGRLELGDNILRTLKVYLQPL